MISPRLGENIEINTVLQYFSSSLINIGHFGGNDWGCFTYNLCFSSLVYAVLLHLYGLIIYFTTIFHICAGGANITSSSSDDSCSDGYSSLIQVVVVVELYHCQAGFHASSHFLHVFHLQCE